MTAVERRVRSPRTIFKDREDAHRFSCSHCSSVLKDPVQLPCGHRLCKSCADELIATKKVPTCAECNEEIVEEDGCKYFPDRFVKREILTLLVVCLYSEFGCKWEGTYQEFHKHVHTCSFASSKCEYCGETVRQSQLKSHNQSCPRIPKLCPLAPFGCSHETMVSNKLHDHMEDNSVQHMAMIASRLLAVEDRLREPKANRSTRKIEPRSSFFRGSGQNRVEPDGADVCDSGLGKSLSSMGKTKIVARLQDVETYGSMAPQFDQLRVESMLTEKVEELQHEMMEKFTSELREKDNELAVLKANITKLEKLIRLKNAEQEDRDFRLSLIENSNHDGSMIWKIPQFSQRKADAVSGKYTSIFSLPFYSGRYGYKMCLRLYIMGDGIGKGTHLSLFFVVMRGEFDNILQWPFTHKVTFKLINQAGGRDIVDTFQPDPMSSSFRKPRSDMNIASGCPRFVSHTELERGGFIVDDTVFIKCMIDTSTIQEK